MKGILFELKNAFNRPNNSLYQIILINIIVFVILAVLKVFAELGGIKNVFELVYDNFNIPRGVGEFIRKPWTIITYAFSHDLNDIFHILFNMLAFYWFGRLVKEYLGSDKLISIYILGAVAGGAIYLFAYNVVPFYVERLAQDQRIAELQNLILPGMVGASASVFAVAVAAATLLPQHRFYLIFIGPVKIVYIVGVYIFLSFIGSVGSNAGGNLAHLGGALLGYIYISRLQKGSDIGKFIISFINYFKSFFIKQSNIKVSYKRKESKKKSKAPVKTTTIKTKGKGSASQDEIDAILDKINASGYESLSKEEKQKLFNAGDN